LPTIFFLPTTTEHKFYFFFFFTMIEYTKMIIFGRLSKEQKTFFYLRKKRPKFVLLKFGYVGLMSVLILTKT
jgi:hypothetical protein